jgi:hypothetical protein
MACACSGCRRPHLERRPRLRRRERAGAQLVPAEGTIGAFFDTFILLSNPNAYDVDAALTFLLDTGGTIPYATTIGANRRVTINIEEVPGMPAGASVATT